MGCATGVVKAVVFVFNVAFVLAGLALLVLGILFKLKVDTEAIDTDDFKTLSYAPIFCIAVGSVVFIIAFFGCCGVLKENNCMLSTYAVILLLILALQIAIGVYAFVQIHNPQSFNEMIKKGMKKTLRGYDEDGIAKSFFDEMQATLHCCGVNGPADYAPRANLPPSCCGQEEGDCTIVSKAALEGCGDKFSDILEENSRIIGIIVLVVAATELIGAILVFALINSIKNEERRGTYA